MPRIQILELPTEHHGDDMTAPFLLVIDQAPHDEPLSQSFREDLELTDNLAERVGARAVLCFEDTIEIPANEVPVDQNGIPIRFAVEGDYTRFREQLDAEIAAAQRRLAENGLTFGQPRPMPTSARLTHQDHAEQRDVAP